MKPLDEIALRRAMEEAQKVREIQESEVFRKCLEATKKEFDRAMLADDDSAAMRARHDRRGLERFLGKLAKVQKAGDDAAKRLDEIKRARQEGIEPVELLNKGIV